MHQPGAPDTVIIRHHPLLLATRAWCPAALIAVAAVLVVVVASASAAIAPSVAGLLVRLAGLVALVGGLWAGWCYLEWRGDFLYLTPERLIEIAGVRGITEERRELRLVRIQSVELRQTNLLARWCGCADLIITLAGTGPLYFPAAREPALAQSRLLARLHTRDHERAAIDDLTIRASVEQLLDDEPPPLLPPEATPAPAARQRRRAPLRPRPLPRLYFGRRIEGIAWRRHRWFLARSWLAPALLIAFACAIPFLLDRLALTATLPYAGALVLCALVAALAWMAWLYADWRNDHYIVTPDRLIEIEQLPLGLRQQISEAALDKVQDIRYRLPHPLANLLDFGDVIVHTGSTSGPFIFRGIAHPRQLADQIDRHVSAARLAEEQARHQALRAEFSRWLVAYDDLQRAPDDD